jgi:hypothetical protein
MGSMVVALAICSPDIKPNLNEVLMVPRTAASIRFPVAGAYASASLVRMAIVCEKSRRCQGMLNSSASPVTTWATIRKAPLIVLREPADREAK